MGTSNRIGDVAEVELAAAAVHLGIPVLKPLTDHGRYDLGLEIGGRLYRVQCKAGPLNEDGSVIVVNIATCCYAPRGYVRTTYTQDEIDLLGVYCDGLDRCYLLPSHLIAGRSGIYLRLTPPRNRQRACITLASDFEFAGAVAQLEERRRGTPKATGSSPVSSIPKSWGPPPSAIGSNEFRNRFGYYLERAAAGEAISITRHGKPYARLSPPDSLFDSAPPPARPASPRASGVGSASIA